MARKNGDATTNGEPLFSWLRRVVPAGYAEATLELTGTAPLLMKSADVDTESELYRSFVLLSKKRGKSLDDEARLRELEWQLSLYLDEDLGPYIPGQNIKELLRSAATKWSKGEEIKRSLIVVLTRIPLVYDGPRDQDTLWEDGYRYTTLVSNGGASRGRVMRCRPKFDEWTVAAELAFDPEDLDLDLLHLVTERAQKFGLGDGRGIGFGSFKSTLVPGSLNKAPARGSALATIDQFRELAHQAMRSRIMSESVSA